MDLNKHLNMDQMLYDLKDVTVIKVLDNRIKNDGKNVIATLESISGHWFSVTVWTHYSVKDDVCRSENKCRKWNAIYNGFK